MYPEKVAKDYSLIFLEYNLIRIGQVAYFAQSADRRFIDTVVDCEFRQIASRGDCLFR